MDEIKLIRSKKKRKQNPEGESIMRNDITIHPHERVDDLHRDGHLIIQDPKRFCFGVDAVILSGFAKVKRARMYWI